MLRVLSRITSPQQVKFIGLLNIKNLKFCNNLSDNILSNNEISYCMNDINEGNIYYQPGIDAEYYNPNSKYFGGKSFHDRVRITCESGHGGPGAVTFESHCKKVGKPDGGDGGKGGDVILKCNGLLSGFQLKKKYFKAQPGVFGKNRSANGKNGSDCIIYVPLGTIVYQIGIYEDNESIKHGSKRYYNDNLDDLRSNNINNDLSDLISYHKPNIKQLSSKEFLFEFLNKNEQIIVCKGGLGGIGNKKLLNNAKEHPKYSERGKEGEKIILELELKSIADVGLVGFPNAGKSTLISCVSNAKPCISSFPFTTLNPHIGYVNYKDNYNLKVLKMRWADIPGIIEGASENKGLGLEFLRHIERCKVLIYVLDIVSCDDRCPLDDFNNLKNELYYYDKSLLDKPSIIFCNKYDIIQDSKYHNQLYLKDNMTVNDFINDVNNKINILKNNNNNWPVIVGSAVTKDVNELIETCKYCVEYEYKKSLDETSLTSDHEWKSGTIVKLSQDTTEHNMNDSHATKEGELPVNIADNVTWGDISWSDDHKLDKEELIDPYGCEDYYQPQPITNWKIHNQNKENNLLVEHIDQINQKEQIKQKIVENYNFNDNNNNTNSDCDSDDDDILCNIFNISKESINEHENIKIKPKGLLKNLQN